MGQIDRVDRRTDTVFLLLRYAGATRSVRLQLLTFLLERETEYTEVYDDAVGFEYSSGTAGPFSKHLCREIDLLREMNAVTSAGDSRQSVTATDGGVASAERRLRLTKKGERIAEQLMSALETRQATELRGFVQTYDTRSLGDLLQYIHREYTTYVSETHYERRSEGATGE